MFNNAVYMTSVLRNANQKFWQLDRVWIVRRRLRRVVTHQLEKRLYRSARLVDPMNVKYDETLQTNTAIR